MVLHPENLIHKIADEVDVFIGDLDKDGAGFAQEFPLQEQAVAQVGEVGVDAEFPGVAEALIISGSWVRSESVRSLTSRLLTNGWKLEPYLMP